jgi:hypothetical protein
MSGVGEASLTPVLIPDPPSQARRRQRQENAIEFLNILAPDNECFDEAGMVSSRP